MKCRDRPYGKEDFEKYVSYIDYVTEGDIENCIWCNKVGGKIYCFGHCSDWHEQEVKMHRTCSRKRRTNKRERYLKHQNHLKYLYKAVGNCYPTPVMYMPDGSYYKRLCRGKRSKYLKRQSSKKIRRYRGNLSNGNMAHKLYDFWWEYC